MKRRSSILRCVALSVGFGGSVFAQAGAKPDPFAPPGPTLHEMKAEFEDVLVEDDRLPREFRLRGDSAPAKRLAAEIHLIKPSSRLPEPVLLPQVIRYLNNEFKSQGLACRVKLMLLPTGGEDVPDYYQRMLYLAMGRNERLTLALEKGTLGEILDALAENCNAALIHYVGDLIVVGHRVGE